MEIDNITPSGASLLVDTHSEVLLQHGGVATCLSYNSVEEMTLAEFLRDEVKTLSSTDRSLYILRDACAGAYTFILGDKVIKYNLADVSEVPLSTMVEHLYRDKVEEVVPNLQYPLIALSKSSTTRVLTVRLESMHRRYKAPCIDVETHIWTPPLWFSVAFNKADDLINASVCVVPDLYEDNRNAKLFRWPLTNVFASGIICMGDAVMEKAVDATSDGARLQHVIDLFFNAHFNLDLIMSPKELNNMVADAYDKASHKDEYAAIIRNTQNAATRELLRILCVLEDKEGWRRLKLYPMSVDPVTFWRAK